MKKDSRSAIRSILSLLWRTQRQVIITTAGILAGALVLITGLYTYREHRLQIQYPRGYLEESLDDPAEEDRVYSIASHFECVACGVCQDMPLETCTCTFAVDARNLIRGEILAHARDQSIIGKVEEQFGGLEENHKSQDESNKHRHHP
ncbi:MAG: cytochrome c-type biogenesis protein CcmH [Ignavibacteriales bacterium]|nr:cytochrome c-type biogenesis protein CcmH [Ignavibacteriales bacterium]